MFLPNDTLKAAFHFDIVVNLTLYLIRYDDLCLKRKCKDALDVKQPY